MYSCIKRCRLCLSNEKFQIPIFGEVAQEMQICLKIRTCLPVQVSEDDDFPKTICYKCVSALDQSYNLWRTCSKSEAILQNLTYKAKQEFSAANMQPQSFRSKLNSPPVPHTAFLKANSRRLLLPTGMALDVESDSEEELEQTTEINAPRTLSAATATASELVSTEWFWESSAVHIDTSPDFLEPLSQPSPDARQKSGFQLDTTMNPSPYIAKPDQSQTVTTNYSPHIVDSGQCQIVATNYSPYITRPDQSQTVTTNYSPHITASGQSQTVTTNYSPHIVDSGQCQIVATNYSPHITRPDQSQTVTTNYSPHITESDQCQTVATNYSPHMAKPDQNIRTTAPMETEAQTMQHSPPGNSWRSVSLFGMSANTWRDFYRSGDMFRHCQLRGDRDRPSQNNTGGSTVLNTAPSTAAATAPRPSEKSYENVLQAMNERNCRTINQHSDAPVTLLNFLRAQKPPVDSNDKPQQGPK